MAGKRVLILALMAQLCSLVVFGQLKRTVVAFPEEQYIIFNSSFSFSSMKAKPYRDGDHKMQKVCIEIDQPTHLYYIQSFTDKSEALALHYYSLLLFPGDSVVLDQKKEIKFATGINNYLDDLMTMSLAYEPNRNEIRQQLAQKGLNSFVSSLQDAFHGNEQKIEKLTLPDRLKMALHSFNYLVKCKTIVGINYADFNARDNKTIDSLYADVVQNTQRFDLINSPFVHSVYYRLIARRIKSNGLAPDKLWDNLKLASDFLFFKKFLKSGLYLSNANSPKDREEKFAQIKAAHLADPELTALYLELKNKQPVLENLVVPNLSQIRLSDRSGNELSLAAVLARNKGKVLLIDFWASWCVPCRGELPAFVRYRNRLKNNRIAFVNFSIDLDSKTADWRKALVEEKETNNPNQFRMIDWKNAELAKLIGLRNIPRYIIMDDKGKILNSEFLKPSNAAFEEELRKYMQ